MIKKRKMFRPMKKKSKGIPSKAEPVKKKKEVIKLSDPKEVVKLPEPKLPEPEVDPGDNWELVSKKCIGRLVQSRHQTTDYAFEERTERLKVPGGHIYRVTATFHAEGRFMVYPMVFVPDTKEKA